ncbi:hypothetical protein NKH91_14650 [Mesorhizobium sp. M0894]|uniref:hypothetical protein n=1 Tax=unclassified Mesorhizobium TaxID=325217 RepID=UPI00333962F5
MAHWEFNLSDPSSVRVGVTQRDQFNNDDVGLAEALVREVIQNSSDAHLDPDAYSDIGPVKVRFSLKAIHGGEAQKLAQQISALTPHFTACGIDTAPLAETSCRILVIEDFNTKGLTGSFDDIDKGNFDSFWRVVGDSEKSGQSGGRWGLGKLVYSSSSRLRVFYGLTVRKGDAGPALMGQVVAANHRIGDHYYPSHGFWFDQRSTGNLKLQLPITDATEIAAFGSMMGISRSGQTGLSLAIPYVLPGIDEATIIEGVVANYYFPILAGRLVVEVGDTVINASTFLEIAEKSQSVSNAQTPFEFVKEISDKADKTAGISAIKPIGSEQLDESHFTADDIATMKKLYADGQLVHVRVPVIVKPKNGPDKSSTIDLFLEALPNGERPYCLIGRGPIILPGERRYFSGAMARGALVANHTGIAALLGDAENPAHTAWNPRAEKLGQNWRNPQQTLTAVRHSLRNLYGLIAEHAETEDNEALLDFFSLADQAQGAKGKRKKTPKPIIIVTPREKAISIKARKGGFEIVAGPAAAKWTYPRAIRVRMAYDMIGANPFNRHSKFDFDLNTDDEIQLDAKNADIEIIKPNVVKLIVQSPEFHLSAGGFDLKRDVVVDARANP